MLWLGGANVKQTMSGNYILEGKTPVRCDNMIEWAKWFEKAERHVAQENIGEVRISTVFLGLDHGWGEPKPVLFETMVFGGPLDQEQDRYYTWDEAEAGHRNMVERVKASPPNDKIGSGTGDAAPKHD